MEYLAGTVVRFMLDELEKAGCPFDASLFKCIPCDASKAGGFSPDYGVSIWTEQDGCTREGQYEDERHTAETL